MSDQKDVVEIIAAVIASPDWIAEIDAARSVIERLEAKGYTITRGSHGVRHRQEPFESK